ncbi:MAG: flagellar filament capping protein FliD [Pseudomonadota bacterium]
MSSANLNNIYVGENGRIQLSGLNSNIDFVDVVDKMIAARRIPAATLEDRIEKNDEKLSALQEMKSLTNAFKDAMANLYGATSFDKSKNIFESKQVFAASSNPNGPASSAGQLMGFVATNAAATGSYTFEVSQIASKHKLASNTIAANPTDSATGVTGTGSFTIGTATGNTQITVDDGDSLTDIRDKINATSDATGVQASVIKVADGQSTLVFNSTAEGVANRIELSDDSGAVLQNLGILSDATTINVANEIDVGNDAQFTLDGVAITRSSNNISDLIDGVTISLYDAEPDTKIRIEIEKDLNQAKEAIVSFTEAYNELQTFINEKTYVDPDTGEAGEDSILLGNSTVKSIESMLQRLVGSEAQGVTDRPDKTDYSVLREIGITFVTQAEATDDLAINTLQIDDTKLNAALLNESTEVMELFNFKSTGDNSNLTMLNFSSKTTAGQYSFDIQASGGVITGATYTIDGGAPVAATVNGNTIVTENGLSYLYTGSGNANETMTANVSVGIGTQMFFSLQDILNEDTGSLTQEIASIETQNTGYEKKIDIIDWRLEGQRESLLNQFINMETALARMKNIQTSLDELMAAGKNND